MGSGVELYIQKQLDCIKKIVSKTCIGPGQYQLYLIGSGARNELTVRQDTGNYYADSDIECYLVSDNKKVFDYVNQINAELIATPQLTISAEISGADWNTIKNFKTRQWLVDAAHFNKMLWSSTNVEVQNVFNRFLGNEIPKIDFYELITNRIMEYNRTSAPYALVKLYCDCAGVLSALGDEYRSSYGGRLKYIESINVDSYNKIFKSEYVTVLFFEQLKHALRYKLSGNVQYLSLIHNTFHSNSVTMQQAIVSILKSTVLGDQIVIPEEKLEQLYRSFIKSQPLAYRIVGYGRDLLNAPIASSGIILRMGLRLSPSQWVRLKGIEEFLQLNKESKQWHNEWKLLCKGV